MNWQSLRVVRRVLLLGLVLLLAGGCEVIVEDTVPGPGPGPGPVAPDREITCANFEDFNQNCAPDCNITWDCELAYDSLSVADQIALDACSDCLVDNLDAGFCADCAVPEEGIDSCQFFMEDLLGVDCW